VTKTELLANIRRDRAQLDALVARVGDARMTEPTLEDDRSVKDVIAHISAWEKICMALVRNNTPLDPPSPGASGPSTDLINQRIYEGSRDRPLEDVVEGARRSYAELLAMIAGLSDDALSAVLGAGQEGAEASPPVGQLISSNSDDHYREHIAQIARWLDGA
jgi:hypothetical protein